MDGLKTGKSTKLGSNGDKEERCYDKGMLQGPALLYGHKGDKLEFTYKVRQIDFPYPYPYVLGGIFLTSYPCLLYTSDAADE